MDAEGEGGRNWEIEIDTYTLLILCIRAKTWKQTKCPSTDEWIKKMCHIYTTEYY